MMASGDPDNPTYRAYMGAAFVPFDEFKRRLLEPEPPSIPDTTITARVDAAMHSEMSSSAPPPGLEQERQEELRAEQRREAVKAGFIK